MYRILISGYYGFNNIGDESILTAVVGSLRERLPAAVTGEDRYEQLSLLDIYPQREVEMGQQRRSS